MQVAPGMDLRGAAQRVASADTAAAFLGAMHDEYGEVMTALQLAQVGDQGSDFTAGVLVDAM